VVCPGRRKDDGQEESAPLYVFFYEAVLNMLWPPLNYFRLHLLYICLLSIFGTVAHFPGCITASSLQHQQIERVPCAGGLALYLSQLGLISEMSYLDALVHGVSTSTQTG
jgi:hypothetical protein